MSRFEELGQNKTTILMKLIEDERIVKCLTNNEQNFLDVPLPVNFDSTSCIYNTIFPYRFIPTTQESAKSFITMRFGYRSNGRTFKIGSIYFYLIVHNTLLTTSYGSLRYDMLLNYIDEVFNSSEELGFDDLEFSETDEFIVNESYCGIYISYKLREFQ